MICFLLRSQHLQTGNQDSQAMFSPISFPSAESLMPGSRIIILYHGILKTTEMDLRRAERRGTEGDSQSSAAD